MATYNRRTLLKGATAATAGALGSRLMAPSVARAQGAALGNSVKALVFDVFGTVVDWRNGVAREARTILSPLGHSLASLAFAAAWRAQYQPGMDDVRTGKIPFADP